MRYHGSPEAPVFMNQTPPHVYFCLSPILLLKERSSHSDFAGYTSSHNPEFQPILSQMLENLNGLGMSLLTCEIEFEAAKR